jgi:hypothetical protein
MTGQGILVGLFIFGLVIFAFSRQGHKELENNKGLEAARMAKVLELITAGTTDINFILTAAPLVISDGEKVVAVLPNATLLESRSVRVRQGSRESSSMRMMYGYSTGSGGYLFSGLLKLAQSRRNNQRKRENLIGHLLATASAPCS